MTIISLPRGTKRGAAALSTTVLLALGAAVPAVAGDTTTVTETVTSVDECPSISTPVEIMPGLAVPMTDMDVWARFMSSDVFAQCGVYAPYTVSFTDSAVVLTTAEEDAAGPGTDMALSRAYGQDRFPLTKIVDADVQADGGELRFVSQNLVIDGTQLGYSTMVFVSDTDTVYLSKTKESMPKAAFLEGIASRAITGDVFLVHVGYTNSADKTGRTATIDSVTYAGTTFDFGVASEAEPHEPAAPTSKDDCKNGGWESFGFANQGQCIASFQANERAEK